MHFLLPFCWGIILSAVGMGIAVWLFPHLGLLDFPSRYGLKRKRLPYPGGLVLLALMLGICRIHPQFGVTVLPLLFLGFMSFVDDRTPISPWIRLFGQLCCAAYVFWAGIQITFIGDPFHATNFELGQYPLVAFGVTVVWIVAVQNALNWFDGIKGLAVGVSGVGFLTLGVLGIMRPELFFDPHHTPLTLANFYMAGVCAGGLYFFLRGKILLGDTGSQTLGFLLATLSIFSGAKIATTLLVLGLPLLDFVFVILRRVLVERRSPFQGDQKHLHHNLRRRLGEFSAALVLILISAGLGGIAVSFSGMQKLIALLCAIAVILVLSVWAAGKTKTTA